MRWIVAASVMCLACMTALGQAGFWAGPTADPFAPAATSDEVEALAKAAGLSTDSAEAARSLVSAYTTAIRRAEHVMGRTVERSRLTHASQERDAMVEAWNRAEAARRAVHTELSKSLLTDLQSLLPPGSEEAWNSFERARRRRTLLGQAWRIGATADMIEVARGEKIPESPELRELLAGYEVDLDRLLVARMPIATEYETRMQAMEEKGDKTGAEALFNAMLEADCAIARLNRTTAAKLTALTPPEAQGRVRDRLLTARWAYVHTETPLRRRVEALIKSGRLDEARRRVLAEAAQRFDEQSRALDDRNLTRLEDAECAAVYARAHDPETAASQQAAQLDWYDSGRKLELELLDVLDKVATEEDLDAVEP